MTEDALAVVTPESVISVSSDVEGTEGLAVLSVEADDALVVALEVGT